MRSSRGRNFGHPMLVAWIEALAAGARQDGRPDLLIGDMAQPRGGPMLTGHDSHQLGLEVDIWFAAAPAHLDLLRRAALTPEVDRIFVNAAIKQAACRTSTGERGWLRKLRPWPGHSEHFHVALKCPNAGCANRNPIPSGEGCGKELAHWFRDEVRFPKPAPPAKILTLNDLPKACRKVLAAP
jgi:penicillin-insensitive murein endopeptidase